MHRQQTGSLLDRELPIRASFYMEMGNSGVLFIEEIKFAGKARAGDVQMRCFIPANYFHMHPSICSLELEPRPEILFDSPLCEAWFHCKEQALAKEPRFGAEDG